MSGLVKVAMIRDASVPMGQSGPLTLGCPCGAQPATTVDGPDVACQCGRLYTANGWLITDNYTGQLASWQDEPDLGAGR